MLGLEASVLISRIITLVIAFTIHEFSHAFIANALGDNTPRLAGRLTLNPFAHLDFMGTLMLLFAGFGWAKPVPINPYNIRQRSKAGLMWVSLAGPLSNIVLAILAALPLRFGLVSYFNTSANFLPTFGQFLLEFVVINITLFLFNLIPLAPLDGEKVLTFFLPANLARSYEKIRPYGPIILLSIVFIGPLLNFDILGMIIRTPMINLTRFLIGIN